MKKKELVTTNDDLSKRKTTKNKDVTGTRAGKVVVHTGNLEDSFQRREITLVLLLEHSPVEDKEEDSQDPHVILSWSRCTSFHLKWIPHLVSASIFVACGLIK